MNCPAAIESLVRYGGWDGDVYMITDRKSCFDEDVIIRNSNIQKEKFHLQVVDEDFGGGGFDLVHPKIGARKNRVRSFAMKARLFEVIKDPKIQTIAYIDCDILFALEGCAKDFITAGPSWEERKIKFSHLFEGDDGSLLGLHAGTMVAHREHSREVLRIWRQEIEKGQSEGDNDAYMAAYFAMQRQIDAADDAARSRNSSGSSKGKASTVAVKPQQNILLPGALLKPVGSRTPDDRYEKFLDPANATLHCMNHISKARCAKYGRQAEQKFVDKFALRTYEGGHPYCTHQLLQPLLYGWFPFSYLPYCPKLEQYL